MNGGTFSKSPPGRRGRPDLRPHARPHRHPGLRGPGRPAHGHRPRGRLDPDPVPEASRRALALRPRPSRAAPCPQARPPAPLDADESRRQAPLVSVDRPPESRQDHGRCRRRGSPSVPEGTTAWFLHCGRRHRRADDDDRGRPGPRQPADHRDLHHRRGSRGAGFSGSDVGSEGGFGRIRRLKASGEGP